METIQVYPCPRCADCGLDPKDGKLCWFCKGRGKITYLACEGIPTENLQLGSVAKLIRAAEDANVILAWLGSLDYTKIDPRQEGERQRVINKLRAALEPFGKGE